MQERPQRAHRGLSLPSFHSISLTGILSMRQRRLPPPLVLSGGTSGSLAPLFGAELEEMRLRRAACKALTWGVAWPFLCRNSVIDVTLAPHPQLHSLLVR